MCRECHRRSHRGHKTTDLHAKIQESKDQLNAFLSLGKEQEQQMCNRSLILKQYRQEIESYVDNALENIIKQRDHVQQEIVAACKEQESKLNKFKQEITMKLDEEEIELQSCRTRIGNLERRAQKILSQSDPSNFISQCHTVLSSGFPKSPPKCDVTKRKLQYREPLSSEQSDPQCFRLFLQDHLLGFFINEDDRNIMAARNDVPGTASLTDSVFSMGGHSVATYLSSRSNPLQLSRRSMGSKSSLCPSIEEEVEPFEEIQTSVQRRTIARFWTKTNTKTFKGSHLKIFSDVLLREGSMWICGWNQNRVFSKDTVLVRVNVPDYKLVTKHKMSDKQAQEPTIMFPFDKSILFAKIGGDKIFNFDMESHRFKKILSTSKITITALCCSDKHIFILDNGKPKSIEIFDSDLKSQGKVPTGLENIKDCAIGMCLVNDTDENYKSTVQTPIAGKPDTGQSTPTHMSSGHAGKIVIISISAPSPSIRAVSQKQGLIWELNYRTHTQIDIRFNPKSVTASEAGDVFMAERGTNRVIVLLNLL